MKPAGFLYWALDTAEKTGNKARATKRHKDTIKRKKLEKSKGVAEAFEISVGAAKDLTEKDEVKRKKSTGQPRGKGKWMSDAPNKIMTRKKEKWM